MSVGLLGTDYQHTSLEVLEKIYFSKESALEFWKTIEPTGPVTECVILSTCNRVEIYFVADDLEAAREWMLSALSSFKHVPPEPLNRSLIYVAGEDAVISHLFRVVSGVESMVFGENEILSQVKEAHHHAQHIGSTGAFLNKLFQVAVTCGKRVRKETAIGRGSYSVSSIAVECMRHTYPNFLETKILVIGVGTMGLRAIKKLAALKHPHLFITNRHEEKLPQLAEKYHLQPVSFLNLQTQVSQFDIVLVATSSDSYVVGPNHFKKSYKSHLIIDLSVPRNADPVLAQHPNITLVSVEGLKETASQTVSTRKKELSKIQAILEDEALNLTKWVQFKKGLHPVLAG
jgi:glutamyl-tRNA reductase